MTTVTAQELPPAPRALPGDVDLPEPPTYRLKRRLLGPAMTTEQLKHERLSKRLALGVLSSDCISSSAYGTEEMLLVLLPAFGVAAFSLLLPMTAVILVVLAIVTLSYRQVVMVYTRAGGSYVVARENFGPAVAQIAAVALIIDYIVTVAVQSAAGTAALTSALPALAPWNLEITVGVVLVLFYGNLRGVREAGRAFALPTYLFVGSVAFVIVLGIFRELVGNLPHYALNAPGAVPLGNGHALLSYAAVFVLLRSFANGGSSLTGLEAISNGVGVFRRPEGPNARRTLVLMSLILGSLVAGVSWLAHQTHAMPYLSGTPTVISQVARAVLGPSLAGHIGFLFVQAATMLILYTGANTPFNGFPALANFVAEDAFLPRWLTKRGHRLAFSNGIVVLAVVSVALLLGTGAHVDKLVAFYAIGVFTGFTMAGFGMARYFRRQGGRFWRVKVAVNLLSGSVSLLVVAIFGVTKFTEGAWIVLLLFPILVFGLIRLNREYRAEAKTLAATGAGATEPNYARHVVVVLVDSVDLATLRALRYARGLRPGDLRAVHFVVDAAHAQAVETAWDEHPGIGVPLHLIECPDRRVTRAALELAVRLTGDPNTHVTFLLPRRTYSPLLGRLLHDRTADDIARAVARVPNAAATIVPFDVRVPLSAPEVAAKSRAGLRSLPRPAEPAPAPVPAPEPPAAAAGPDGATPIRELGYRRRATVVGRVREVRLKPLSGTPMLEAELCDSTGGIAVLFYGRRRIAGIAPGARLRVSGMVGERGGRLAIANPVFELLPDG